MFFTRERERGRFNQKPEGSVSFKGCNEVRLSISQTPFSRRCLRFSFFQEFFQEFFPASRAPLTELNFSWREPDPRSQTWNSNVRLFVSRGRTARFVGRVLQSCVCFENINTILVLEFLSLFLSLTVKLYILCKTLVLSRVGAIFFSCQQFRRIRWIREIYGARRWITVLINVFRENEQEWLPRDQKFAGNSSCLRLFIVGFADILL